VAWAISQAEKKTQARGNALGFAVAVTGVALVTVLTMYLLMHIA
jgi:hypothetical protein